MMIQTPKQIPNSCSGSFDVDSDHITNTRPIESDLLMEGYRNKKISLNHSLGVSSNNAIITDDV